VRRSRRSRAWSRARPVARARRGSGGGRVLEALVAERAGPPLAARAKRLGGRGSRAVPARAAPRRSGRIVPHPAPSVGRPQVSCERRDARDCGDASVRLFAPADRRAQAARGGSSICRHARRAPEPKLCGDGAPRGPRRPEPHEHPAGPSHRASTGGSGLAGDADRRRLVAPCPPEAASRSGRLRSAR